MIEGLFILVLGMFIGWNYPQPEFALFIQRKILKSIKNLIDNNEDNKREK